MIAYILKYYYYKKCGNDSMSLLLKLVMKMKILWSVRVTSQPVACAVAGVRQPSSRLTTRYSDRRNVKRYTFNSNNFYSFHSSMGGRALKHLFL